MPTADVIVTGVRAGLRLYGAMRKAYVDGTRGRALVLPLPRSPGVDFSTADAWFAGDGRHCRDEYPRVDELMRVEEPTDAEKRELLELYRVLWVRDNPSDGDGSITGAEIDALLRIRQWENGHGPDPSPLQTVAGTLVNVAVDFFLETPGAVSEDRPAGRALRTVLEAMDRTDFATVATPEIAPKLLVAVLSGVAANPDLAAGGKRGRELVANVASSLAASVEEHLADAPSGEREEAGLWVEMVARALIEGGAGTVLANPARFLGAGEDEAALVSRVGKAVTDLVLGEDRVTFRPLLSEEGLTVVAKAALAAVASNPGILKIGDKGIRTILAAVAGDLAKLPGTFSPDLFPEVARLLLEKTAENMDLVWGNRFSAAPRHLLVTATKTFLAEFSKAGKDGVWKPTFTKGQVLGALEAVLDEVLDDPEWLVARAEGESPVLGAAVAGIVESLAKVDGARLSAETGVAVLVAGLRAVGARVSLLDGITPALDAVFGPIFAEDLEPDRRFRLARNSTVLAIVEVALAELARAGAEEANVAALRAAVEAELARTGPFDPEDFRGLLVARLEAA